ncbi:MAG: two pore domain potassium channel family protein [Rhizobacter sp.]|nr:two pore domain potassium channel family protein [Rhizobacter sp.]
MASPGSARRHTPLGLLLCGALLLSALLPAGEGAVALGVRSATALLIVLRWGESLKPWFWRGSLPYLLALAVGVLGLCGLGFWWLEPRAQTFGDGLWLAFTTAATVGYGDIVPSTPAAKIFAVFVVLMGFAVLSLVTAAIAAMWVQTEERRIEREILQDIHRQIHGLHNEITAMRREQSSERQSV